MIFCTQNKKNCLDVARKYSPTVYKELLKIKTTGLKVYIHDIV